MQPRTFTCQAFMSTCVVLFDRVLFDRLLSLFSSSCSSLFSSSLKSWPSPPHYLIHPISGQNTLRGTFVIARQPSRFVICTDNQVPPSNSEEILLVHGSPW